MYILIVEDDHLQAELLIETFRDESDLASALINRISTEREFRERFEEIAHNPPDVIIMDVMLRWADPTPDTIEPPPEIKMDGFHRAGLRNEKQLAGDPRTRDIPVVLYTILEAADLEGMAERPTVYYQPKDSEYGPLVQTIRSLVRRKVS